MKVNNMNRGDKRPIGYKDGQKYFMDQKLKSNPKYSYVKGTMNTGHTVDKVKIVGNNVAWKRRAEIFSRINGSFLTKLMKIEKNKESIYDLELTRCVDQASVPNENNIIFSRGDTNYSNSRNNFSEFQNQSKNDFKRFTSKTGQINNLHDNTQFSKFSKFSKQTDNKFVLTMRTAFDDMEIEINEHTDFLLQDLRNEQQFAEYHIKDAVNFPSSNIGRDFFTQLLISFKNKPNKVIVVYHETDQSTIPFVTQLIQKGFENIFLLTGGIYEFVVKCHEWIEGVRIPMKVEKISDQSRLTIFSRPKEVVIQYRQSTPSKYMCETKNKMCKHNYTTKSRILPPMDLNVHPNSIINVTKSEVIVPKKSYRTNNSFMRQDKSNVFNDANISKIHKIKKNHTGFNKSRLLDLHNPNVSKSIEISSINFRPNDSKFDKSFQNKSENFEVTEKPTNLILNMENNSFAYEERRNFFKKDQPITLKPNYNRCDIRYDHFG